MSIVNSQIYNNTASYVRAHVQKIPSPRWDFHIWLALVLAGWRCLRPGWYGDFVIMHHQWKQSFHCAALIFISSHRPDGMFCLLICPCPIRLSPFTWDPI